MDVIVCTLFTGVGATALVDLWTVARKRLFDVPAPDYALLGRWLAHMRSARFHHPAIAAAPVVNGERVIGWIAHYLIGIAFAALLVRVWGVEWLARPTLVPALIVGLASVAAPFLLMQPAMGAGVAASRSRHPGAARLQSVITHAVFGLGLYVAGSAASHFHLR